MTFIEVDIWHRMGSLRMFLLLRDVDLVKLLLLIVDEGEGEWGCLGRWGRVAEGVWSVKG